MTKHPAMDAKKSRKIENALIFGSNGQDGHYLEELLKNNKISIITISRTAGDIRGDISDYTFVKNVIQSYAPQYIFNFAALSTTRHDALFEHNSSIGTGTINILEAARLFAPNANIFLAGSAMQFLNEGVPIDESTPFEALSMYAAARIYAVHIARYYRKAFLQKNYVGYLFNHDSPLRSERHVNQKIAKAAQRIASGSQEKLYLGDLSVKKEFMHAKDAVAAIWTLVNQEDVFEAVIGTGVDYSIQEWVEQCFSLVNLDWQEHVVNENNYIPEYQRLVSNPTRIFSLGWQPEESFESLAMLMMRGKP